MANLALAKLGISKGVVDFNTEASNEARVIRLHFASAWKKALEAHPWAFAQEEAPLLLLGPGKFGFKYMYAYPANCITITQIAHKGEFARIELQNEFKLKFKHYFHGGVNKTVVSSVSDAHAQFTVELSQEIDAPAHFGDAVAAILSLKIAPSLIANNFGKLKQEIMDSVDNDISTAIATDLGKEPPANNAPSTYEMHVLMGG